MGLKNSQYQAIMRSYEQKQLRSHDLLNSHYEEVCRVLPEFRTLDESISDLSIRRGKQLLNGDDHAVDSLHEELSTLRERKKALLKSAGFPDDYRNRSMNAASVKIQATLTTRSAAASKKQSPICFTVSPIWQEFFAMRISILSHWIIIPRTSKTLVPVVPPEM